MDKFDNIYLDADSDDDDVESGDVYVEEYFEEFFPRSQRTRSGTYALCILCMVGPSCILAEIPIHASGPA